MSAFAFVLVAAVCACSLDPVAAKGGKEMDFNKTQNFGISFNTNDGEFFAQTKLIDPLIDIKETSLKIIELLKLFSKSVKAFQKKAMKTMMAAKVKAAELKVAGAKKGKLAKAGLKGAAKVKGVAAAKEAVELKDDSKEKEVSKDFGKVKESDDGTSSGKGVAFVKGKDKGKDKGKGKGKDKDEDKATKEDAFAQGADGVKQVVNGMKTIKDALLNAKEAKKAIDDQNTMLVKTIAIPKMVNIERLPGLNVLMGVLKQWASVCESCGGAAAAA